MAEVTQTKNSVAAYGMYGTSDGGVTWFPINVDGNSTQSNLYTREAKAPTYEDNVNGKAVVETRCQYTTITTATTTTITARIIHSISIIGGTLGAITGYDNSAASGATPLPTFTPTSTLPAPSIILDEVMTSGSFTIVTAAATILNISWSS